MDSTGGTASQIIGTFVTGTPRQAPLYFLDATSEERVFVALTLGPGIGVILMKNHRFNFWLPFCTPQRGGSHLEFSHFFTLPSRIPRWCLPSLFTDVRSEKKKKKGVLSKRRTLGNSLNTAEQRLTTLTPFKKLWVSSSIKLNLQTSWPNDI